jgi:hypothetical protein
LAGAYSGRLRQVNSSFSPERIGIVVTKMEPFRSGHRLKLWKR